jgi:hypothetical protein
MNLFKNSVVVRAALWVKENPIPSRIVGASFVGLTVIFSVLWVFGRDVEPVTFMLSLCSTFFFALPAIADLIIGRKPVSEMAYTELLDFIAHSNPKSDWKGITADGKEEFFCLHDTRLRIRHYHGEEGIQNDDFKEVWANSFPSNRACGLWYDIVYDGGCIRRFLFVAVDGFRAYLPCPNRPSHSIDRLQDTIARIIAMNDELYERYLKQSGIKNENN